MPTQTEQVLLFGDLSPVCMGRDHTHTGDLSVGLLCFRMFCVDKTFLLCTRWSFL